MAEKPRFDISATQVIGGALAAAGAAVAASLLGVYGTVIGSAVMSVVATVGTALYGHSVQRGKQTIERVRYNRTTGKMQRLGDDGVPVEDDGKPTAELESDAASEPTQDLSDMPTEKLAADEPAGASAGAGGSARTGLGDRLRGLNWRTISVTAAVVLVLGLGSVTLAELAMGQSVSSALGGGHGKHRVSVVSAFHGNGGGGGTTGGRVHRHTPSPSASTSDPTPTASTSSPEESPSSVPETTTETTTTGPTDEPTTTVSTTAPTPAPPSTSAPTQGGDTTQGLVPNQQATGGDTKP